MSRDRCRVLAAAAVGCAVLALPATAGAVKVRPSSSTAKPFLDTRAPAREKAAKAGTTVAAARPNAATRSARAALQKRLGAQGVLSIDPLTGTPRQLMRTDGALSASRAGARATIARDFIDANRVALGLSQADVDGLSVYRQASTGRGLTLVHYQQLYRGIPAFDNDLRVAVDRYGRVISVAGSPRRNLSVASVEPALTGAEALRKLQANVDVVRDVAVTSGPSGVRKVTRFKGGDFARLVLFGTADGARLAYHVTYHANASALYDAVVDANSGAVLYRQNLTKDVANASVYPNHPGASAPAAVDLEIYGLTPGATNLSGRFSRAWSDVNDDDEINAGEEIPPSSGTDFVYPFTAFPGPGCSTSEPCAWDPTDRDSWETNREQNGVQAFYLVSRYHDHLEDPAGAGFDDDWGSFEVGGTGGDDPVLTQTDDGANTDGAGGPDDFHANNANMSTPPDGESPTMQMYLFNEDFGFANVNGGDDSGVVWHEYTHGLSNRLVLNADGSGALSTDQAGAMGEAWSDWYASNFQVALGFKDDTLGTPGEIDVGEYTDLVPHTLRTQALDCPVGAVDDDCRGGLGTGFGGYTYGDFGRVTDGPEVHADGEIWAETLWDMRQKLRTLLATEQATTEATDAIVADAMRISPPEPSMLDMRNSILLAANAIFSGAADNLTWSTFANRGMGYYAAATDGADRTPAEDFTMPPDPNGPKGAITGRVTDGDTGLPVEGVVVGIGGHASRPEFPEYLGDTTGADGTYSITDAPVGTYPKLAFKASAGYDPAVASNVVVSQDQTTSRDMVVRRDWAALDGGATVEDVSDDTGGPFGCGVAQALDHSQGTAWSAYNPESVDPDNPGTGDPTVTIELPATIDVSAFVMDPSAGCGDDPSATTGEYRVETSADGVNWRTAIEGTGANAFTEEAYGRFTTVPPAGATGQDTKFVRLTMLNPLDEGAACGGCSGADFIDFTEFKVVGGPRNVLPTGSLAVAPGSTLTGAPVRFTASFTDPDSVIAGYDWDFDGNGTVDRSTAEPVTDFAYDAARTYTPAVTARDFRGGGTTARSSVAVAQAAGPVPGAGIPAIPTVTLPKTGRGGKLIVPVQCNDRCKVTMKITVSKKVAKKLGRKSRTLRTVTRSIKGTSQKRLTIQLKRSVRRAAKKAGLKQLTAKLTVRAAYEDGRRRLVSRTVRIRV